MEPLSQARISMAAGVEGDFRGRPGKRQVTIVAREDWEAACAELGVELDWSLRRANVLVEGLALDQTAGRRLELGGATLEITCETDPCRIMDLQHPGLRKALEPAWRGGVSCRVIADGDVRVGDAVTLDPT
jgi:MOSC domain-containing protein YiiM